MISLYVWIYKRKNCDSYLFVVSNFWALFFELISKFGLCSFYFPLRSMLLNTLCSPPFDSLVGWVNERTHWRGNFSHQQTICALKARFSTSKFVLQYCKRLPWHSLVKLSSYWFGLTQKLKKQVNKKKITLL